MMAATLRLERFDRGKLGLSAASRTTEISEDAYQHGYRQGQKDACNDQLTTLTTALLECAEKLADEDLILAAARQDVARSLVPLLEAVLATIGPANHQERLESFLTSHLVHLSSPADQRNCVIRCAAELGSQISLILQRHDLQRIRIEAQPSDTLSVELAMEGGTSVFNPDETINQIRQLARDMAREITS